LSGAGENAVLANGVRTASASVIMTRFIGAAAGAAKGLPTPLSSYTEPADAGLGEIFAGRGG